MTVARIEKLVFTLSLTHDQVQEHLVSLKNLLAEVTPTVKGDRYTVNYSISIEYIDEICRRLAALLEITKDAKILCNTEELLHGECLIQKLFDQIKELRRRL